MTNLPIQPVVDRESAFAFLLGVLFNQQMRAESAWQAPYELGRRIGGLTPEAVLAIGDAEFRALFAAAPAVHPFVAKMAENVIEAAHIVTVDYGGDVRNIWTPAVGAGEFITRFMAFPGIGDHKARIALFVATVQLGIAIRRDGGNYSIRSCGSLAQMFHPIHEPVFTEE